MAEIIKKDDLVAGIQKFEKVGCFAFDEFPRDKWVKTKCLDCGKINEQYWDKDGFPTKTIWRCTCAMKRKKEA